MNEFENLGLTTSAGLQDDLGVLFSDPSRIVAMVAVLVNGDGSCEVRIHCKDGFPIVSALYQIASDILVARPDAAHGDC